MKRWTKPMEDNIFTMGKKSLTLDDYLCYDSESRSNLGDFSQAFNTMTAQLREREEALKKQAQRGAAPDA